MWLMITLKVTKNKGLTVTLEYTLKTTGGFKWTPEAIVSWNHMYYEAIVSWNYNTTY